ncbi:DUF4230 domain-containing protein [Haloimpatiens sp. FM7315]|uniref:DUF4230 domain-containing protein n=1 Tax=Haloimpatiens sp. FM7315 TaxID=3298609 RepID=UPI0035A26641
MRKRRTLKFKLFSIVILIAIILGVYLGYRIFKNPDGENKIWILPKIHSSKKILTKEVIINSIKEKSELITLEASLKEKIVLDDSWGNFSLFKKVQNINFYGNGVYCVDLSKVPKENIIIDNDNKSLTIKLSKPYVKNITIDESKTEYETIQKGVLRFGEINLEPSEYQIILSEAKLKMLNEMRKVDTYNEAYKTSKKVLSSLLNNLVTKSTNSSYKINIEFQ